MLDPNPPITIKCDAINGVVSKTVTSGKPQIQIRENTNGEITLAGVSELGVDSLEEMAACLERGSLCRATASTNMNTRSRFLPFPAVGWFLLIGRFSLFFCLQSISCHFHNHTGAERTGRVTNKG